MAYGVPFDELINLNEGQQADEYKATKLAKTIIDKGFENLHDMKRGGGLENKYARSYINAKKAEGKELSDEEKNDVYAKRYMNPNYHSQSILDLYDKKRAEKDLTPDDHAEILRASSAYNRHMRRHSKNESSIFESVEIV